MASAKHAVCLPYDVKTGIFDKRSEAALTLLSYLHASEMNARRTLRSIRISLHADITLLTSAADSTTVSALGISRPTPKLSVLGTTTMTGS